MDNNIYVIDLVWSETERHKPPADTTFPRYALVMDPPEDSDCAADGWSVIVQIADGIGEKRAKAYLRFIFWDLAPKFISLGENIVLRSGKEIVAEGKIVSIVNDPAVYNQLMSWNPKIPKLES